MSKAEPWCAGRMDRSDGEKPKARPPGLFQARGEGKPPVAHRRGQPMSKAEPWCAGRMDPFPAAGTKNLEISPLRRRVTFPTAEKSPKRRLETKVSNTFLPLLRGTFFSCRRVMPGLYRFLRRCRWLSDRSSCPVGTARAAAVATWSALRKECFPKAPNESLPPARGKGWGLAEGAHASTPVQFLIPNS